MSLFNLHYICLSGKMGCPLWLPMDTAVSFLNFRYKIPELAFIFQKNLILFFYFLQRNTRNALLLG